MTEQPQHCEHECVCMGYANRSEMFEDGICTKPICPHDTRPAPAADAPTTRCCESCKNIPCKPLNRIPCVHHPENPCIENGCTDIENCDEICEHSRIFSPAWVKQHDAAIREQAKWEEREKVLKELNLWRIKRMNGMLKKDVWMGWNDETDFIQSLRSTSSSTAKEPERGDQR